MALSDYLVTDDLTIILALVAAGLFLLHNLYKPQALVHPILLGRQSDVARVRNPRQSAVYRNYSTGMLGRFPLRPTKDQQVVLDLVKPDADAPRTLWNTKTTNPQLRERAANFGAGLARLAGVVSQESNVLLLLNDSIEFLISDLALASHSVPSFTLAKLSLLSSVIENHPPSVIITEASFLSHLLELIYDSNEGGHHTLVVVGDTSGIKIPRVDGVKILLWDDVERDGATHDKPTLPVPEPSDVFTVAFYESHLGKLEGVKITHQNLTAGVAATRALLPTSSALSPLDTIVSAFSLSSPYGRTVAYTALFEGTGFATLDSTKVVKPEDAPVLHGLPDFQTYSQYSISSPTILFVRPDHVNALSSAIEVEAKGSWLLYNFAYRHKLAGILEGYITKQSLWDRLVFDAARVAVLGKGAGTIRAVIVSGGNIDIQSITSARIAFSVPLVHAHAHPISAGPLFATHPFDLQTFPINNRSIAGATSGDNYAFTYATPVGAPAVNVEAKLFDIDDTAVENGTDPVGNLYVRGPAVGRPLSVPDDEPEDDEHGWRTLGERARIAPNGTFKITTPPRFWHLQQQEQEGASK